MIRITGRRKKRMTVEEFLKMRIEVPKDPELPGDVGKTLNRVCHNHRVQPYEVMGKSRDQRVVAARREFIELMHFRLRFYPSEIAFVLSMDVTSVKHHLGLRTKSPVKYDHLKSIYQ